MGTWVTLAMYGVAAVFCATIIGVALRRHVRSGRRLGDAFRDSGAVVEVEADEAAAEALCKRALLEVNDTRTTRKFKRRKLHALSHLDHNSGNLSVSFALEPVDADHTRIRVSLYPRDGQLALKYTERREELIALFGAWLAEQGRGRVLESGYGDVIAWGN